MEVPMLKTLEGVYHNGHVELKEEPLGVLSDARVLVTFVSPEVVDLRGRGIGEEQAASLRARLSTFAQDWESPEMDIYDERYAG
jgi:hypothetical protein